MTPTLPKLVSRNNYLKSKKLIQEARIARNRSMLIQICSVLGNYPDWHGAVEASQHCFELSLKSLWLMLGFNYPHNHNPAKDLDQVKERLFMLFPHLENEPLFKSFETWVKKRGEYMAKLHGTSFYGDEKGNYASELFTEEDASRIWEDAEMCYKFALLPIELSGAKMGLLTEEEKKNLESFSTMIQELRKKNKEEIERLIRERLSTY
jgi:HEPN domain-containing protein